MGLFLKQSTSATVQIGPFVDSGDGDTDEAGFTIEDGDILLSKNGGIYAQKNEASNCTYDTAGFYRCPLDDTDTNTLGRLQLDVHVVGALHVYHEYMVVTANVYDTLCGTDLLQSDLTQIGGVAQSATDLKDFADTGYDPSGHAVVTDSVDDVSAILKVQKNKWAISGTTLTIYDDDGTTPLYQFTLDSASAPTSRTPL